MDDNGWTQALDFAQSALNSQTAYLNQQSYIEGEKEEAEKQRTWTEQMLDKQNAWSLQQWNLTNEYNSPSAQVQRLRDAGLNPLFYGLDGSSANAFQSAEPLGYERASFRGLANPSVGLDAAQAIAQISNIQANTAKQKNETLSEVQRRERIQADIILAKQELENMKANEKLTKSQSEEIDKRISWLDRLNEATIAEKESNSALNKATRNRIDELLEGEKILQSKNIQDFDERWKKIRAEISKLSKETGLLEKDIENYALNHASNGFMGTGLSLQNLFRGAKSLGETISEHPKIQEGQSILAEDMR